MTDTRGWRDPLPDAGVDSHWPDFLATVDLRISYARRLGQRQEWRTFDPPIRTLNPPRQRAVEEVRLHASWPGRQRARAS